MLHLHHNIEQPAIAVIPPQAVGTTGASNGSLSGVIDRRGFGSVEFLYQYGTAGATGDTITPVVLECETSGGTFTSVADSDLIGTEAGAGLPAQATSRTSGVGKNLAKRLGYKGNKPFLKTRLYGLGTATGLVAANVVLGNPRKAPTATQ